MFEDGVADYIVAQHILEYIPRQDVVPALLEWKRVLKQGCHLEIRVTDIASLAKAAFLHSISGEMGLPAEMVLGLLYGRQDSEYDIRASGYTSVYLQGILNTLGYSCESVVMEDYDVIISARSI